MEPALADGEGENGVDHRGRSQEAGQSAEFPHPRRAEENPSGDAGGDGGTSDGVYSRRRRA